MKKSRNLKLTTFIAASSVLTQIPLYAADLAVDKQATAPGAELKYKSQSKVPTFNLLVKKPGKGQQEMVKMAIIPRLNLGEEKILKAKDPGELPIPAARPMVSFTINKKPSPNEVDTSKWTQNGRADSYKAPAAKTVLTVDKTKQAPAIPTFSQVEVGSLNQPQDKVLALQELSAERLKLLQALIFLENKKDYAMALALFAELINDKEVGIEATYFLGVASKELGLYSDFKFRMLQIMKSNDQGLKAKAVKMMAEAAEPGDKDLVGYLDPLIESLKLDLTQIDQYNLNRAKYYLEKSNLTKAFAGVDEIMPESPLYIDAMFLKSLILYKGNQVQESITAQSIVLQMIEEKKNPAKDELKAIVALTLARLYFQTEKYKEAFDTYLKVDKKSPEWLQAMTEQAWTQILSGDYEGAAGNMFSLHTDFFKKAFNPESYVVRTAGYLNLCQYGDGARVVHEFKKKYSPVAKQMQTFKNDHKDNISYYDTIKQWAKNPDIPTVNGLPREFIFALTQHPSFIEEQKRINSLEDQVGRMNKVTMNLIKSEKAALASQGGAQKQLAALKKSFDAATSTDKKEKIREEYRFQEKRLMSAKIAHYIAKKARESIKELRQAGLGRLEEEKKSYLKNAGNAIAKRFEAMYSKLSESLDQAEILQYELFSGAGEHLRYQMAGGEVGDKEKKELKVEEGKALNWDFKGEIWADEIGHYRSSLKNVCPPDENKDGADNKLSSTTQPSTSNK